MDKQEILAKLPEDARNLVAIQERKDSWILEHPYIKDGNLYANVITAIEGLGGKQTGYFDKAMHYEIPKVVESGVTPNVVKQDTAPPPDLSVPEQPYDLKLSAEKLGKLCPVLLDKNGRVIDGMHRMELDPKWPTLTLQNIDTPVKRSLARIASNFCRRTVEPEELTREITTLIGYGLKPKQISELTGISERTIYRHMPEHLKDKVKAEAGKTKSEVLRDVVPPVTTKPMTQDTRQLVVCEGCHVGTRDPQIWHSRTLCPDCNRKALLNPELWERKFPRNRIPTKENAKIKEKIKKRVEETWEQRKAHMHPSVSKMDEAIYLKLQQSKKLRELGYRVVFQKPYILTTSDVTLEKPGKEIPVFLDNIEIHKNRRERDKEIRGFLARRESVTPLSRDYERFSEKEIERLFKEIMEALQQ